MISIVIISKDEASLDSTLADVATQASQLDESWEILVVDASEGRLDHIWQRHQANVRWLAFQQSPGAAVSIPHQRNAGVRAAYGDIIVFTDAGCRPEAEWLTQLVTPLFHGEQVTVGLTRATSEAPGLYDDLSKDAQDEYLTECSTINLAFHRAAYDAVGGFDESFAYGSDVDFSWRLVDKGYRLRSVPDAVVRHDWGSWRRQLRRSYVYGKARGRLYRKHSSRRRRVLRTDPMVVVYPAFLLGLPLTLIVPLYPLLLIIPAWRNRSHGAVRVLVDHLTFGLGVLTELASR